MSTGTAIITDALKLIGVNSVVTPPAPENIIDGMNTLNSMLETWRSLDIIIGTTPLGVPGGELSEPPDTRNAIVSNLAISIAPYFSNGKQIVTPELKSLATSQYNTISDIYKNNPIPKKVLSSTTPVGSGNRNGVNNLNYWPQGTEVGD